MLASYNVHRCVGIDRRLSEARIAQVISTIGADVVGLQELSMRRARSGESDQAAKIAQQLRWNVLFQPALQIGAKISVMQSSVAIRFALFAQRNFQAKVHGIAGSRGLRFGPKLKLRLVRSNS